MKTPAPVFLVGAGPGDPELLTVRARKLIDEAEVVVYDRLVSDEVLALIPPGTARIFAGKAAAQHHMPQDEINQLLVRLAQSGRRVVRLKGGDPYIFGRGSEEALHLAAEDIPFEVVPGITAAAGVAAEVGVPLTHRGLASGVRFVTGHCQADAELDMDWEGLADPDTTLVVYMGLANLGRIAARLMAAGLPSATPAVAAMRGTLAGQRHLVTTLERLADEVHAAGFKAPTLIIIGRVAELALRLGWRPSQAAPTVPAQTIEDKTAHG